jgi:hypothetical protein
MKKNLVLLLLLLLFCNAVIAQQNYSKVLDLLLHNKREEARSLFDKQFAKQKNNNIDLLFLDALIEEELGESNFDETLLKNIEPLQNSQYFIAPFINSNIVFSNINEEGYNDLTFAKIDFLKNSEKFKNLPIVKYRAAVSAYKRKNTEEANSYYNNLNVIREWSFCGVFENLNGSGLNTEYEPETYPKNDKLFDASSNGKVGWFIPKSYSKDVYHHFTNETEYGNGIIYAQVFIDVPEDKNYLISYGTSSAIKVFVNDVEVAIKEETGKTNLDAFNVKVKLKKGTNRLLLKIELLSNSNYFSGQIKNLDGTFASELNISNQYKSYNNSTYDELEAEEVILDFEKYFEDLVTKNPDNILYKYFLYQAYACNQKKELAHNVIEGLDILYPKSSFVSKMFLNYYNMDNELQKGQEVIKNMESNDKDYYLVTVNKLQDKDWLKAAQISELEEYSEKSKTYKSTYISKMYDFMIASRKSDMDGMIDIFEKIYEETHNNDKFRLIAAGLYKSIKNDKTKYIEIIKDIIKTRDNIDAIYTLQDYYNDLNEKEEVKKIALSLIEREPSYNYLRNSLIEILIKENKYEEAIKLIDENLEYFPYSFNNFQKKARVYSLMKKDKEAEKYYIKALSHNSSNTSLRKKLYDLMNIHDEIEDVETKDIYELIKKRRNSTLKGDYGVTLLLDEFIVNVFPEGGRNSKARFIYEITAENGIENLKEYNLSTYNVSLLKSEIVKKNGSLVPAEVSGDMLVFPKLEVGDVIYIEYDYTSNSYGRFYKDFEVSSVFNGSYPSMEAIFTIIHAPDLKLYINYKNGEIPLVEKKIKNKIIKQWRKSNIPSIPILEPYTPEYSDITNEVTVSTIKSWKEIANWYSDLVKKNIKFDKISSNTFNKIFPNGFQQFSEEERALKIYEYIEENITYSYLDFRQSGYVHQKPSKTITSKLGDCKDLSTLFVTLAQKADLKSNLVLVLTNNNGLKSLPLPSKDFNHCIAKVIINNKDVFLEMTDRYLPFKAMPMSLYNANALVISFDKIENEKASLIKIPFNNAVTNVLNSKYVIDLDDNAKTFSNKHIFQGLSKGYYSELFSNATTEDMRKKEFEDYYNNRLNNLIVFQDSKMISTSKFDPVIEFETKFIVNERLQQLGSLKIVTIPFIDKVYTKDIISEESRKYPILYADYESMKEYNTEIVLNIPKGKKFVEIPESKVFSFKNHEYQITYELPTPNQLIVKRKVKLDWEDIQTIDYPKYKKYVEDVLATEDQIAGYK